MTTSTYSFPFDNEFLERQMTTVLLRHHRHRGRSGPDRALLRLLLSLRHQGHGRQEDCASSLEAASSIECLLLGVTHWDGNVSNHSHLRMIKENHLNSVFSTELNTCVYNK